MLVGWLLTYTLFHKVSWEPRQIAGEWSVAHILHTITPLIYLMTNLKGVIEHVRRELSKVVNKTWDFIATGTTVIDNIVASVGKPAPRSPYIPKGARAKRSRARATMIRLTLDAIEVSGVPKYAAKMIAILARHAQHAVTAMCTVKRRNSQGKSRGKSPRRRGRCQKARHNPAERSNRTPTDHHPEADLRPEAYSKRARTAFKTRPNAGSKRAWAYRRGHTLHIDRDPPVDHAGHRWHTP
jgi:hypothetical protein